MTNGNKALDYILSFDDPYLRAIREHGKQTWGLEGIRQLLEKLGDPYLQYPTIHIAGTKGKGSTAAFITQVLIASGIKTGLYVSPHLVDYRERIQINREMISDDELEKLVEDAKPILEEMPLSTFEVTTALALWHFAREGCEVGVIEVGLGGRLDATSIVKPEAAVITNISLDHTQLLGNTLAEIAGEKAAIIKKGVPIVSARQGKEAAEVIAAKASQEESQLVRIGDEWTVEVDELTWDGSEARIGEKGSEAPYSISLPGRFQAENAALALAALSVTELPVTEEGKRRGLNNVRWEGRLETIRKSPRVVVDSAHNPLSVKQAVETIKTLREQEGSTDGLVAIFGCMADKDIEGMLESLIPAAKTMIFTKVEHHRATEQEELQKTAEAHPSSSGVKILTAKTPADAYELALSEAKNTDTILITGSLAIAGSVKQTAERKE